MGGDREVHDSYMWRKMDWKLIVFLNRPLSQGFGGLDEIGGELYDLKNDPHEFINLYKDPGQAGIREAMKTELLMRLAAVWETYPSGRG